MPVFRRVDTHKWKKWRFYPGAVTLMQPRIILACLCGLTVSIQIYILLIGHDKTRPLPSGCRKCCLKFVYNLWARIHGYVIFAAHYKTKYVTEEDVNFYEEWLGTRDEQEAEQRVVEQDAENSKPRRVPRRGPGKCSTIVCNHIGFIEILNLVCSPL